MNSQPCRFASSLLVAVALVALAILASACADFGSVYSPTAPSEIPPPIAAPAESFVRIQSVMPAEGTLINSTDFEAAYVILEFGVDQRTLDRVAATNGQQILLTKAGASLDGKEPMSGWWMQRTGLASHGNTTHEVRVILSAHPDVRQTDYIMGFLVLRKHGAEGPYGPYEEEELLRTVVPRRYLWK